MNHDVVIYNFRRELVERLIKDKYDVVISSPYGERIDDLISMGCAYKKALIERHGTNIFNDLVGIITKLVRNGCCINVHNKT